VSRAGRGIDDPMGKQSASSWRSGKTTARMAASADCRKDHSFDFESCIVRHSPFVPRLTPLGICVSLSSTIAVFVALSVHVRAQDLRTFKLAADPPSQSILLEDSSTTWTSQSRMLRSTYRPLEPSFQPRCDAASPEGTQKKSDDNDGERNQ